MVTRDNLRPRSTYPPSLATGQTEDIALEVSLNQVITFTITEHVARQEALVPEGNVSLCGILCHEEVRKAL